MRYQGSMFINRYVTYVIFNFGQDDTPSTAESDKKDKKKEEKRGR